jgi:hypothetical protein
MRVPDTPGTEIRTPALGGPCESLRLTVQYVATATPGSQATSYFSGRAVARGMIDETAEEIREMQTHSSSVVAVKAAEALRSLFDNEFGSVEEYLRSLDANSSALRGANPSHASLWSTQNEIVSAFKVAHADTVEAAQ